MEWTREKTLALISEYRKRRGLWDMTHEDYRKKDMKQKLLVEVSASLGGNIAIGEIEKKFHTLRTQYHREINRMKRKEPYNSKWFGFKNLQFLSSPKACRSSKGRIKSEITDEGTVTAKYIIKESVSPQHSQPLHETASGETTSSHNVSDEFLIHRKANVSTYDAQATSRSHELEKLIEETTKDGDDVEDAKPKMTIKDIPTYEHMAYSSPTPIHGHGHATNGRGIEVNASGEHEIIHHPHPHAHSHGHSHSHHHQQQQQQQVEDDGDENMETLETAPSTEEEMTYHSPGTASVGQHHSHHAMPRIVKIQTRERPEHTDDYYDDQLQQQQQHGQASAQLPTLTPHHIHTIPATTKRIYYDASSHQHTTTILTTPPSVTSQHNGPSALIASTAPRQQQQQQQQPPAPPQTQPTHLATQHTSPISATSQQQAPLQQLQQQDHRQQQQQQHVRDEFAIYGEYVANELRGIVNREILIVLKNKINTALFEASMAELQK